MKFKTVLIFFAFLLTITDFAYAGRSIYNPGYRDYREQIRRTNNLSASSTKFYKQLKIKGQNLKDECRIETVDKLRLDYAVQKELSKKFQEYLPTIIAEMKKKISQILKQTINSQNVTTVLDNLSDRPTHSDIDKLAKNFDNKTIIFDIYNEEREHRIRVSIFHARPNFLNYSQCENWIKSFAAHNPCNPNTKDSDNYVSSLNEYTIEGPSKIYNFCPVVDLQEIINMCASGRFETFDEHGEFEYVSYINYSIEENGKYKWTTTSYPTPNQDHFNLNEPELSYILSQLDESCFKENE